jgi:hypothetical protein
MKEPLTRRFSITVSNSVCSYSHQPLVAIAALTFSTAFLLSCHPCAQSLLVQHFNPNLPR